MISGIIHAHSIFSDDSLITIETISKFIHKKGLGFFVLTDHDSIAGSLALKEHINRLGIPTEIPLAAEYRTEWGELIGAFLAEEIHSRTVDQFIQEVHAQGGLVLLPHPFVGHVSIERLAEKVDIIEVFNSRCSSAQNQLSYQLAYRFNKPMYCGSDAHLPWDLANVVVGIDSKLGLREALIKNGLVPINCEFTVRGGIRLSQAVKMVRQRDLGPAFKKINSLFKV